MFKKLFRISRLWKKILWVVFILGASSFLFSGTVGIVNEAHAQTEETTQTNTPATSDKAEVVWLVDLALKVIYILLRPLLVIAGLSIDNTLVYGTVLHMDAPLWDFRNIMKNFANFALWFLVLFAIIRKIFSFGKAGDKREPQKIITQTLIAGVLIQISRFVMAALVDLSTVATYAVGALPLNVISSTPLGDKKIMSAHVEMDLNKFEKVVNGNDYYKVRYSVPNPNGGADLNFSECKTKNHYVIGRMDGGTWFRNEQAWWGGTKNACVKWGQLIFFNEFPNTYNANTNTDYQLELSKVLDVCDQDYRPDREACQFIVRSSGKSATEYTCGERFTNVIIPDISNLHLNETPPYVFADDDSFNRLLEPAQYNIVGWLENSTVYWWTYWDSRLKDNDAALTLDKIVDKSKWFVGPLITMYSSLMDFSQLANTNNETSFGEIGGEMLIKTWFAIWLFFPLIALAVVLIIRVGFMRAVIVWSPFLILMKAFGREEKLWEHFKIANIIQVIFAPVITVFALSISLVFMSALVASIKTWWTSGFDISSQTTEAWTQMFSFFKDCLELELNGFEGLGGALDVFSRFLLNMIGIGLMRGIVFAAIKMNSIGKKFWQQIQDFGASFFQTLPIIPVPGGEPVGLGSLGTVVGNLPSEAARQMDTRWEQRARAFVYWEEGETGELTSKQTKTFVTNIWGGTEVAKAAEEITKKEGTAAQEIIQSSLPALFTAVNTLAWPEKEKAIAGIGEYVWQTNWFESAQLDVAIKGKDKIDDVNTALNNPTPELTKALTTLATANTKRSFTDENNNTVEYTLTNTNGKFTFVKTPTTPWTAQ